MARVARSDQFEQGLNSLRQHEPGQPACSPFHFSASNLRVQLVAAKVEIDTLPAMVATFVLNEESA